MVEFVDWAALSSKILNDDDGCDSDTHESSEATRNIAIVSPNYANNASTMELDDSFEPYRIGQAASSSSIDYAQLSSDMLNNHGSDWIDEDFEPENCDSSANESNPRGHRGTRTEEELYNRNASELALVQLLMEGFERPCKCTDKDCQHVTVVNAANMRITLWLNGQQTKHRRENLLELMGQLSSPITLARFADNNEAVNRIDYLIGSFHVCENTFCAALGLHSTGSMFRNAKKCICYNQEPKTDVREKSGDRGENAMAWLVHLSMKSGDNSPTKGKVITLTYKKKVHVYRKYVEEVPNPIKLSYFFCLWNLHHPEIKITRESSDFKVCSVCYTLTELANQRNRPKIEKDFIQTVLKAHLAQQVCEREYFRVSEKFALEGDLISIVIDGMDQVKTYIPIWCSFRTARETDKMQSFNKVGQALIGVRVCMKLKDPVTRLFLFMCDSAIQKDSNSTIECINRTLNIILPEYARLNLKPPSMLHVQMDNARDNKSKYVMAYLTDLTMRKIFTRVSVNFLMVGHTHCNVDHHFGQIADVLRESRSVTPKQLDANVVKANPELHPVVIRLDHCHDMKAYYESHLRDVSGHAKPHQFRFWCNVEGASAEYRMWSNTLWHSIARAVVRAEDKDDKPATPVMLGRDLAQRVAVTTEDGDTASVLDVVVGSEVILFVPNETTNIFLKSVPPVGSIPRVANFDEGKEFQSCLDSLQSNEDNTVMFIRDELGNEYEALVAYCRSRLDEIENQDDRVSTWSWPRIERTRYEIESASPNNSNSDIFNLVQEAARNSMSEGDLKLIDSVFSKHIDSGSKQVKIHNPRAEKKADAKLPPPPKGTRWSKRAAAGAKVVAAEKKAEGDKPEEKFDMGAKAEPKRAKAATKRRRR